MTTPEPHDAAAPDDRPDAPRSGASAPDRWVALLAKWTELARAAVALPDTGETGRWRDALPAIIELQAVTHALDEFRRDVNAVDRGVVIDKAEVMLRRSIEVTHRAWSDEPLPDGVAEVIDDARRMLARASTRILLWLLDDDALLTPDPTPLALLAQRHAVPDAIFAVAPGLPVFHGCPVIATVGGTRTDADADPAALDAMVRGAIPEPLVGPELAAWQPQVYRQWDFGAGRAVRDVIAPFDAEVLPGQPLLAPIYDNGEVMPVRMAPRGVDPSLQILPVELAEDAGPLLFTDDLDTDA